MHEYFRSELEKHRLRDLIGFLLPDEQLRETDRPLGGGARAAARHQVSVDHHVVLRIHVRAALLHCRARRRVRCHLPVLADADAVHLQRRGPCGQVEFGIINYTEYSTVYILRNKELRL